MQCFSGFLLISAGYLECQVLGVQRVSGFSDVGGSLSEVFVGLSDLFVLTIL